MPNSPKTPRGGVKGRLRSAARAAERVLSGSEGLLSEAATAHRLLRGAPEHPLKAVAAGLFSFEWARGLVPGLTRSQHRWLNAAAQKLAFGKPVPFTCAAIIDGQLVRVTFWQGRKGQKFESGFRTQPFDPKTPEGKDVKRRFEERTLDPSIVKSLQALGRETQFLQRVGEELHRLRSRGLYTEVEDMRIAALSSPNEQRAALVQFIRKHNPRFK